MDPTFSFPYQPYPIQEKFMRDLYSTIENNKLGIFESPTGTGKSLSICCGALQWLKDSNRKVVEDLKNVINELKNEANGQTDTGDWLQEEYEKIKKNQTLITLQNKLDKINNMSEKFNELQKRVAKQKSNITSKSDSYFQVQKHKNEKNEVEKDPEEENSMKEIEEDDLIVNECEINESTDDEEDNIDNDSDDPFTKIYISSRTHSQISQFVGEIKRTIFNNNTRVVTLASRQHYCINKEVMRLKNVNLINERCLDLQKSKTKSTSVGTDGKVLKRTKINSCTSCPYYNQNNIHHLKDRLLVDILDMEDLVKCGKELKACPYYATRMALDEAEVILISHAGIVSSGARSGISLKLKKNVLILDEAHGLTAALESAHSAPVSFKQITSVKTYLQFYINIYRSKLSSKNLLQLNQMNFIIGKLLGMLKPQNEKKNEAVIFRLEDFVIKAEIDHLNLRPLVEFCRNTRLAPKLHSFSMRYNQQALEEDNLRKSTVNKKKSLESFLSNMSKKKTETEDVIEKIKTDIKQVPTEISAGSGLYALLHFLEMLCDRSDNGRVLVHSAEDTGHLKYLLLNPSEHFSEVVRLCRSVIVAGGTMEPVSEFRSLLTGDSDTDAVNVVKCDHVVPPDHVLAICLAKGPTNVNLNFSYENRMSNELLSEVGRILRNICSIVPGGVVCFLPSYSYEQTVYDHLKKNNIIDTISKKKAIFREPKSASEVDQVLHKYASAIKSKDSVHAGALLLSVVGGKLSEGLNFSDDLGRCVIVVGMPYPNIKSPELQEKLSYLNKSNSGAGSIYYENLCMKAVNQCIGRAVRHANDYACVLLVDERYSRPTTISALPSFVQKSLISNCTFGQSIGSIAKFFARHKHKT